MACRAGVRRSRARRPGDQKEREVREHDRSGRERDDHGELAPAAPSPGDDAEQGQEQHRVELDRDPDTDDERACPKAARGEQCQRAGDEGGGEKVEPREDHAAEESGDEGDGGERDVPVGDRTVETAQPLAHEQDTERPDNGHLGHEDRTIGARGVGHERRQHESGQRTRRVLEPEITVRDKPVRDPLAVRPVERDVRDGVPRELPRHGHRDGDRDEHSACEERVPGQAPWRHGARVSGRGVRGSIKARRTNGSTQGR